MAELTREQIDQMCDTDILDNVVSLFDFQDPVKRATMAAFMKNRAKKVGIQSEFNAVWKACVEADKGLAREYTAAHREPGGIKLDYDSRNQPLQTIENFMQILRNDDYFRTFRYNDFIGKGEITRNLVRHEWSDAEDAAAMHYIEDKHILFHEPKFRMAMREFERERAYHPVRDYIESVQWDGQHRIEQFLVKWLNCDDNDYNREVSRLIFAGGIHRLYDPGCKFDIVPVLIGTKQGEGKSTLVRWLAIKDEWYGELTDFDGQKGIEALQGTWVCEIGELLALVRAQQVEAVKGYLTRQVDKYRAPYNRHTSTIPRQCIFIGTTNKERFLTDKTGNRRWFPIKARSSGRDLFNREKECREYIIQCWAEARAKYNDSFMDTRERAELLASIQDKQREAEEDDWREGMIAAYLDSKRAPCNVCVIELWREALKMGDVIKPSVVDSTAISTIMQRFPNWKRMSKTFYFGSEYGSQRGWELVENSQTSMEEDEECPF